MGAVKRFVCIEGSNSDLQFGELLAGIEYTSDEMRRRHQRRDWYADRGRNESESEGRND